MKEKVENVKSKMQIVSLSELELDVSAVLAGEGADPEQIYARRPQLVEIAESALKSGLPLLSPVFYRNHLELNGSKQQVQEIFKNQNWIQN